jgi:hypothetical protein
MEAGYYRTHSEVSPNGDELAEMAMAPDAGTFNNGQK